MNALVVGSRSVRMIEDQGVDAPARKTQRPIP
jgi:hypothetical protein